MSSSCCDCCGYTSLIGVVFFGITATMVKRENQVFLSHKAGMDLHTITDEDINKKFMLFVYSALVSRSVSQSDAPALTWLVRAFRFSLVRCSSASPRDACSGERKSARWQTKNSCAFATRASPLSRTLLPRPTTECWMTRHGKSQAAKPADRVLFGQENSY